MSDGYRVYRKYKNRLRCWAHLLRKARGLFESLDKEAQGFGKEVLDILNLLMAAVYRAREGPRENLSETYRELLEQFRACCKNYRDSKHEKTGEVAVNATDLLCVCGLIVQYIKPQEKKSSRMKFPAL